MLKSFRIISFLEGLSLLCLAGAMVAKYGFNYPELIRPVGMTHGMLWLVYLVSSLSVSHVLKWSVAYWGFVLLLSIIPGGFIALELQLKKAEAPSSDTTSAG